MRAARIACIWWSAGYITGGASPGSGSSGGGGAGTGPNAPGVGTGNAGGCSGVPGVGTGAFGGVTVLPPPCAGGGRWTMSLMASPGLRIGLPGMLRRRSGKFLKPRSRASC